MAGRKRSRTASSDADAEGAGPSQPAAPTAQERAPDAVVDRRADMADIARRRAAHFANFKDEGEEEQDNVHAGGNQARTLGPWSSAVELINQRQQAQEKRQAKMSMDPSAPTASGATQQEGGLGQLPGSCWVPRRDPSLGARLPCPVPSLDSLCCSLLAEYLDCVMSLEGVPDLIRVKLALAAAARRKLTAEAALLFAEGQPSEVVLPDCKELDRAAMVQLLTLAASHRLERLELGSCGRGFGDLTLGQPLPPLPAPSAATTQQSQEQSQEQREGRPAPRAVPSGLMDAVEALEAAVRALPPPQPQVAWSGTDASEGRGLEGPCLPALQTLKLGGAYRLNDLGLHKVLNLAPGLQTLALPDASRLTSAVLPHVPHLTPHLRFLDLTNCRGLGATALESSLVRLQQLEELSLDGIVEVGDSLVARLACTLPGLRLLSLALCNVSDAGLAALAAHQPQLRSLRVDQCSKVTDQGVQALAGGCSALQLLSVRRVPKVGDAGIVVLAAHGSLRHLALHGNNGVTDASLAALATHCAHTLSSLDISFCRGITAGGLGHCVDSCPELTRLLLFGCSQLDNRFAHGHSLDSLARRGLEGLGTAVTLTA